MVRVPFLSAAVVNGQYDPKGGSSGVLGNAQIELRAIEHAAVRTGGLH